MEPDSLIRLRKALYSENWTELQVNKLFLDTGLVFYEKKPIKGDKTKAANGIAAIVATSQRSGKIYATSLGIENYIIITDIRHIQGLRTRATIFTPGYLDWMFEMIYKTMYFAQDVLGWNDRGNGPRG